MPTYALSGRDLSASNTDSVISGVRLKIRSFVCAKFMSVQVQRADLVECGGLP